MDANEASSPAKLAYHFPTQRTRLSTLVHGALRLDRAFPLGLCTTENHRRADRRRKCCESESLAPHRHPYHTPSPCLGATLIKITDSTDE